MSDWDRKGHLWSLRLVSVPEDGHGDLIHPTPASSNSTAPDQVAASSGSPDQVAGTRGTPQSPVVHQPAPGVEICWDMCFVSDFIFLMGLTCLNIWIMGLTCLYVGLMFVSWDWPVKWAICWNVYGISVIKCGTDLLFTGLFCYTVLLRTLINTIKLITILKTTNVIG